MDNNCVWGCRPNGPSGGACTNCLNSSRSLAGRWQEIAGRAHSATSTAWVWVIHRRGQIQEGKALFYERLACSNAQGVLLYQTKIRDYHTHKERKREAEPLVYFKRFALFTFRFV